MRISINALASRLYFLFLANKRKLIMEMAFRIKAGTPVLYIAKENKIKRKKTETKKFFICTPF